MPYSIDAAFTSSERAVIAGGIKHVEDNTCIRFVPRVADIDYVNIIPGDGASCYAMIPHR